jgi:hypothetical protein
LKHAKPKQKNTEPCTNKIKELMKHLTLISRTYQNTKKQNDAKKGKRKVRKFAMQKQQRCMRIVGTSTM